LELKNIEAANKLFEQLKSVDAAITAINKLAKKVVNSETTSLLRLTVIDERKKNDEASKVSFEEDGSLINPIEEILRRQLSQSFRLNFGGFMGGFDMASKGSQDKNVEELSHNLTEGETMALLQMLLHIKNKTRNAIIEQLKSLGFRE